MLKDLFYKIYSIVADDCSDSTTTNTFHDNTQEDEFKVIIYNE